MKVSAAVGGEIRILPRHELTVVDAPYEHSVRIGDEISPREGSRPLAVVVNEVDTGDAVWIGQRSVAEHRGDQRQRSGGRTMGVRAAADAVVEPIVLEQDVLVQRVRSQAGKIESPRRAQHLVSIGDEVSVGIDIVGIGSRVRRTDVDAGVRLVDVGKSISIRVRKRRRR